MPEILSLALFERGSRVLVARRKGDHPPFGGQWLLPAGAVPSDDSAEAALERHVFHELAVQIGEPSFAETLYLEDADGRRYVANIFRVAGYGGDLRFRAAGDYDDVRWLTSEELAQLSMPPALSTWLRGGRQKLPTASPMPVVGEGPAPDNRQAWNTISRAYQDEKKISTEHLTYSPRCPGEDELQLLGDVANKRVVVLGCGGGQDCIVLAKQGAQVVGIDLSDKQIEYGRRLAEREGVLVTLLQGNVEELRGIDDETQDLALSIHALNYVERIDRAVAEAYRVLRSGGAFVFIVHHPFAVCLEDTPPYAVSKSYWQPELDWQWEFPKPNVSARLRSWYHPIGTWHALLTEAGFRVERVLEPPPREDIRDEWDKAYDLEKARLIPHSLIFKAIKP